MKLHGILNHFEQCAIHNCLQSIISHDMPSCCITGHFKRIPCCNVGLNAYSYLFNFLFILFLLVCENYDVFICYAGPDKPFADELLKILEGKPYCMKVCINYRDFLVGADPLETAAKAIEERCRKVLVILSENFNRCEEADFQAKVALSLSPGWFIN